MKGGGGVLIPFPRKLFFSNPTIPACVAQIEIPFPFPFFYESQSQCTKSHFPAYKKGKSPLPFYPFTTLAVGLTENLAALRCWMVSELEMATVIGKFEASIEKRKKLDPRHYEEAKHV